MKFVYFCCRLFKWSPRSCRTPWYPLVRPWYRPVETPRSAVSNSPTKNFRNSSECEDPLASPRIVPSHLRNERNPTSVTGPLFVPQRRISFSSLPFVGGRLTRVRRNRVHRSSGLYSFVSDSGGTTEERRKKRTSSPYKECFFFLWPYTIWRTERTVGRRRKTPGGEERDGHGPGRSGRCLDKDPSL